MSKIASADCRMLQRRKSNKKKNTQLPQICACNFCFIAFPHMKVTNLDSEAAVLFFFIEKGER